MHVKRGLNKKGFLIIHNKYISLLFKAQIYLFHNNKKKHDKLNCHAFYKKLPLIKME